MSAAVDWRRVAALAGEAAARTLPFDDAVEAALAQAGRVVIACSGGADSICLLLASWYRFAGTDSAIALEVAHYDHGVRADSGQDAQFVGRVAAALALPVHLGWREDQGSASEAELRTVRMAWLTELACGDPILFAHHRDDAVETLLMRLGRGSGLNGLAAPRPVQRFPNALFLRPWLGHSRQALRTVLHQAGAVWREDPTNAQPIARRNHVRHRLLPVMEAAFEHSFAEAVGRSHALLREDAAALEAWADRELPTIEAGCPLVLPKGLPQALWRRALWRFALTNAVTEALSASAVDTILAAWMRGQSGRWSVGDRFLVVRLDGSLAVERRALLGQAFSPIALVPSVTVALPDRALLSAQMVQLTTPQREMILRGSVAEQVECWLARDASLSSAQLRVRTWRPGDVFHPLGAPGRRKLQDCFTDARIPREHRHRLPVILLGDSIVWVPGLPPSQQWRICPNTTAAMQLTYREA